MRNNSGFFICGHEVLAIDSDEIQELLNIEETLQAVERAFVLDAKGEAVMPPKSYVVLPQYPG